MSSISYCGFDFSPYVSAELVEPCGHSVAPRTASVLGRPGAVLLGGDIAPLVLRVRLFWDGRAALDDAGRAHARHVLSAGLLAPSGGELKVPGEPAVTYRDAVLTDAGEWDSLFEDGSCVLEFTCFDPIAYGAYNVIPFETFHVGGSWRTWPEVTLVAAGGVDVVVRNVANGKYVRVAGDGLVAGAVVVADFAAETVTVDGSDASASVSLGSDFFALEPGSCTLAFGGCSSHYARFWDRWV